MFNFSNIFRFPVKNSTKKKKKRKDWFISGNLRVKEVLAVNVQRTGLGPKFATAMDPMAHGHQSDQGEYESFCQLARLFSDNDHGFIRQFVDDQFWTRLNP